MKKLFDKMEIIMGMKKAFLICSFISLNIYVFAQEYFPGDGTQASPFYGTQTNQSTIGPGDVYIGFLGSGDLSTGSFRLTIAAGTTLHIYEGININIPAGGGIRAQGTSSNRVTFTSTGAGVSWGRLYFNPGSRIYQMTYCVIEKGSAPENGSGGAIYAEGVNASYCTISNCEFWGNYAPRRGGAIYAYNGNLTINNCTFHDNMSKWGGALAFNGGVGTYLVDKSVFYSNSATGDEAEGGTIYIPYLAQDVTIQNCLIYNNSCTHPYGSGGIYCGGIFDLCHYINNCTIVGNTPIDVKISGPDQVSLQNTLIYGSDNSVYYDYGTPLADNLINCAVQRVSRAAGEIDISAFPSSFKLNSSNTAADGPNFEDPANHNYLISLISPCRDAGTIDAGWSTPPSYDFLNNGRIGPYDIGAYEVQYNRWTGAIDNVWATAGNWQGGVPTTTSNVVVPKGLTNYPTSSSTQDFTIGTGKRLIIDPGAYVTLGSLTNNGILRLNSGSTGIASLMLETYARGTGSEEIQIYLTGGTAGQGLYKWHYISSPVNPSIPTSIFEANTQDLARFVESLYDGNSGTGWIASDGFIYSTGAYGTGFSDLALGKGYNFWDNDLTRTYTFSGLLNTTALNNINLEYSGPVEGSDYYGYNLLGNPFSCGISWDIIANSANFPLNTSKAIYFTKDDSECTYNNGVGVPYGTTGHVPPMQGFFMKTLSSGNTVTIPLSAREHNQTERYKGESSEIPLIRLYINENNKSDETVVRFDDNAKSDFDFDFDAMKMTKAGKKPSISSLIGTTEMAINGLPFPDQFTEIPLSLGVGQTINGNHTIKTLQLQGLDNYIVTLEDKKNNISLDLKTHPNFTFSDPEGVMTNRFVLKISSNATVIENPTVQDKLFNVYVAFSFINIQTLTDQWDGLRGSIKILDLTGKTICIIPDQVFNKGTVIQIPAPNYSGVFIIEIISDLERHTCKVVVK